MNDFDKLPEDKSAIVCHAKSDALGRLFDIEFDAEEQDFVIGDRWFLGEDEEYDTSTPLVDVPPPPKKRKYVRKQPYYHDYNSNSKYVEIPKERKKLYKPWIPTEHTIHATSDFSTPTSEHGLRLAEFLKEWEWATFYDDLSTAGIDGSFHGSPDHHRERVGKQKVSYGYMSKTEWVTPARSGK